MPRKYTRELLAPLVDGSKSYTQVMQKLGLTPSGGNHRHIAGTIRALGLDTSHFGVTIRLRINAIEETDLRAKVASSRSLAAVLTHFGLPTVGRAHHELKRRLQVLSVDTLHFTGAAWCRGESAKTHPSLAAAVRKRKIPDNEVFVENSLLSVEGQH